MWKNTREWRSAVGNMPCLAQATSVKLASSRFHQLPFLATAHIAPDPSLHDTHYFCSWDEKDTVSLGVLLSRENLWPNANILNKTERLERDLERSAPVLVQYRMWLLSLQIPIFALFNDEALKHVAAWYRDLGVASPSSFSHVSTQVEWFDARYVLVKRTLKRKNGFFSQGAPVEEIVAQIHADLTRLHHVAQHAMRTPIHLPSDLNDALDWLDQRFLCPENHPTDPELRDVYITHGAMLLEGWWLDVRPNQLVARGSGVLGRGSSFYIGIKHRAIRAMARPQWKPLRTRLLHQHLAFKDTYVSSGNNSRERKQLDPVHAWQALLLAHQFRADPETQGWFKRTVFVEHSIIKSTFQDITPAFRPIYFAYLLELYITEAGLGPVLTLTREGMLTVKEWQVLGADNQPRLRLDDPRFMDAFITVWKLHSWRPLDIPPWVYGVFEARFIAGDLRVADILVYHPDHVRILREVCGVHVERIRWMVSWLGHHAHVVDPSLMPALFKLPMETMSSLTTLELSALYEHLERADSALRRQHLDKTKHIVKLAIEKLGEDSFDMLDGILRDALDADILAFVNQHIDALPRLSFKRRALKREQREALEGIDIASFQGQISLHQSDGTLRGALSQGIPDTD